MTQTILPAELSRLFGIKIDEVWAIPPGQKNEIQMGNQIFEIQDWAELIQAESAEVMAQYIHDWYQGYAAITKNKYGKGTAIYLGPTIEKQFFEQKLIEPVSYTHLHFEHSSCKKCQPDCRAGFCVCRIVWQIILVGKGFPIFGRSNRTNNVHLTIYGAVPQGFADRKSVV